MQAGALSPECALSNATLVPDLLVLHAAAYKALAAAQRGELRTRSLHAELVFSLSGSKHVSVHVTGARCKADAMQQLGVSPGLCGPQHCKAVGAQPAAALPPSRLATRRHRRMPSIARLAVTAPSCCLPLPLSPAAATPAVAALSGAVPQSGLPHLRLGRPTPSDADSGDAGAVRHQSRLQASGLLCAFDGTHLILATAHAMRCSWVLTIHAMPAYLWLMR